jgi:hypothetical protein
MLGLRYGKARGHGRNYPESKGSGKYAGMRRQQLTIHRGASRCQRIYDKLVVMIWLWESEKLKLHRGQIQALDNFLAIVERTEAGSILGPWKGPELTQLSEQFLKAPPWKDLISYGDFLWIVFRELGHATKRIPEDYVGLVCKAEDGEKILSDSKTALID